MYPLPLNLGEVTAVDVISEEGGNRGVFFFILPCRVLNFRSLYIVLKIMLLV